MCRSELDERFRSGRPANASASEAWGANSTTWRARSNELASTFVQPEHWTLLHTFIRRRRQSTVRRNTSVRSSYRRKKVGVQEGERKLLRSSHDGIRPFVHRRTGR